MRFNLISISMFLILSATAQSNLDSLKNRLEHREKKPDYIDELNELGFQYILQSPMECLPYINRAIDESDSIGYPEGYFRALTNKGSAYWTLGLPDLALKYYREANTNMVPGNWVPNASLYNNIGEVFKKKILYDSAISYYRRGIQEASKGGKEIIPVMIFYNIGEAHLLQFKNDSARYYFNLSLQNARIKEHNRAIAYSLNGLASLDLRNQDMPRAIQRNRASLIIRKRINDVRGIIQSYHSLAAAFEIQREYQISKIYLDSAILIAEQNSTYDLLSESYNRLSKYFKKKGDYEMALEYATQHYLLNDSLSNHLFVENMDQIKLALFSEIQSIENKLILENQKKIESDNRTRIIVIVGVSCFILMIGVFVYLNIQRRNAVRITANNRRIIETLQRVSHAGSSRDFHDFMKDLLKVSATTLQVDRASLWLYNPEHNTIEISDHYSKKDKFQTLGTKVSIGFFKKYFELLHKENVLAVDDTNSSELTVEYDKKYIKEFGIKSLLDIEIQSEGTFIGILSFEHTSKTRKWSYSDQRFGSSLSNIISSAYLLNENRKLLDALLAKNKQLRDSGFALSHHLREPLSQILGFSTLMKAEKELDNSNIWEYIDEAAHRMDEVITRLTIQLAREDKND